MTREEQYQKYLDLLLKWNERINLTAITDPDEIIIKHFDDSRAVLPFLNNAKTIIDIGSGAGFPGIPIKIERPHTLVTLLDSQRKKVNFLRQVIFELKLEGIEAMQGRAEDPDFFRTHGPFDIVISRATWSLDLFLELAEPYYDQNGACIAMKGPRYEKEIQKAKNVIHKYNLTLVKTHSYTLSSKEERHVLVFKKNSQFPC